MLFVVCKKYILQYYDFVRGLYKSDVSNAEIYKLLTDYFVVCYSIDSHSFILRMGYWLGFMLSFFALAYEQAIC